LVGEAGIVLNPDKFQFAQREVDFAGFHISDERIEPLPKFFDAVKNFPTPTSTTDIRSWFGLVNQVANYAQLRPYMETFRPFLSPRCPFEWNPELNDDLLIGRSKALGIFSFRSTVHANLIFLIVVTMVGAYLSLVPDSSQLLKHTMRQSRERL